MAPPLQEVDFCFQLAKPFEEWSDEAGFWKDVARSKDGVMKVSDRLYRPDALEAKANRREIDRVTFRNVSFSKTTIKKVRFNNCHFVGCLFIGSRLEGCIFSHCSFESTNFYRARFSATYIDPATLVESTPRKSAANVRVELFQELARDYNEQNQPDFQAEAEFRFRQSQRYALTRERMVNRIGRVSFVVKWSRLMLLELATGYGRRPFRVTITIMSSLMGLFAVNYLLWPAIDVMNAATAQPALRGVGAALYFSATFGSGALVPGSPIGMLIVGFEALVGVVLLALVASLVFRFSVRSLLMYALAQFGSRSRSTCDVLSDNDILLVRDRRCPYQRLGNNLRDVASVYSWEGLHYACASGSLFALHLKSEATFLRGDVGRLRDVLESFRPAVSYEKAKNDGRRLFALLERIPPCPAGFGWAYDVAFVAFRTYAIPFSVEAERPSFDFNSLAAILEHRVGSRVSLGQVVRRARRNKHLYRRGLRDPQPNWSLLLRDLEVLAAAMECDIVPRVSALGIAMYSGAPGDYVGLREVERDAISTLGDANNLAETEPATLAMIRKPQVLLSSLYS